MKNKPVRVTSRNLRPSKSYINRSGDLVLHYTWSEKIRWNIHKIFSTMPFVASFLLCALLFAELLFICGLASVLLNAYSTKALYSYLLPVISLGIMCTACFGIAWAVAEEQDRTRYKKALAREAKRRDARSDESDYFIY